MVSGWGVGVAKFWAVTDAHSGLWMGEQSIMDGHAHLPLVSTTAVDARIEGKLRWATGVPVGRVVSVGARLSIQVSAGTADGLVAVINQRKNPTTSSYAAGVGTCSS